MRFVYLLAGVTAVMMMNHKAVGMEANKDESVWLQPNPEALEGWQDMRFGLFIHWGPVSLTGHEIGWSRGGATPVDEYDALYKQFNPEQFDADAWVRIAKEAGMKYLVLTTKHHDGFCLWPSELTDYDIGETPFKRDVVGELAEACREQGIRFGTYYSVCDWHHPDFPYENIKQEKPAHNLERYLSYHRGQVAELIRNYGPLVTMWYDVPQGISREQGEETVVFTRKLQPDILINNRAGGGAGDYDTPEQKVGQFDRRRPWETCMTLCRQWAWKPDDNMKSLQECIHVLLRTIGGDGNLLFNVGPMPDGRIEPRQVERLREMGAWVKTYGDGIYGTRGGPFKPGPWGASTCKGNQVYLFVMQWGSGGRLELPAVNSRITDCRVLSGGTARWTQAQDGLVLTMPSVHQQEIATVVVLTVDGQATDMEPVSVMHRSGSAACGKQAAASNVYQGLEQYGPRMAFDDNPETRWATDADTGSAQLDVDLGVPMEIGRVLIDERDWNRVNKFQVQYRAGDTWKTALEGSTIGENFSAAFDPVTARHFRLNILACKRSGPTIWEFQLFGPTRE